MPLLPVVPRGLRVPVVPLAPVVPQARLVPFVCFGRIHRHFRGRGECLLCRTHCSRAGLHTCSATGKNGTHQSSGLRE
jgi:hypothetical protein